jgi:hypothetical protein
MPLERGVELGSQALDMVMKGISQFRGQQDGLFITGAVKQAIAQTPDTVVEPHP